MTSKEFVSKAIDIVSNYKTLYIMGCFGAPMTTKNKTRYCNNNSYNQQPKRTHLISAASEDTFGFDCVCLIKGILWGWDGNLAKTYGGAVYESNGVPDIGADSMIKKCSGITTDFATIEPGEAVWKSGHIGIYIGDGLAVECTPAWKNRVQITAVRNIGPKEGYNLRTWTKHGKLPYVEYETKLFHVGDLVCITGSKYYSGKTIPSWVLKKRWYVRAVKGDRIVIDKSEDGLYSICSPVKSSDLTLCSKA